MDALDKNSETPLHAAARKGNVEVVKALLKANASKGTVSKDGKTPAEVAEAAGKTEALKELK